MNYLYFILLLINFFCIYFVFHYLFTKIKRINEINEICILELLLLKENSQTQEEQIKTIINKE